MSQGTGLFVSRNGYCGHQNIPWRETHVIPTKIELAAKDYYGLFGRAMLEVQKNLVLIDGNLDPLHSFCMLIRPTALILKQILV